MFKIPTPEEMAVQIAKAEAARQAAEAAYARDTVMPEEIGMRRGQVHAASILVWVRIAEIAGVPFIPAETVATLPMSIVEKVMDNRDDEMTPDEIETMRAATAFCRTGGYWRTELCAPHEVKSAMAHNVSMPDFLPLYLDDPRMLDMHYNMPDVKIVSRPRLTPVRHAGWPIEFRTFFGGRAQSGAASWYYPQTGRFETTPELEALMDRAIEMGRLLHETRERLGLVPCLPERSLTDAAIGSTIDFMMTEEMGLVLVDAGPGYGYGAHPCCFLESEVEGRRWHLADGVDVQ